MKARVIVDTGPLVALLNRADQAHPWVVQRLRDIAPPMVTCEAVLAEATYLTRGLTGARSALLEMLGDDFLTIGMALSDHHSAILAMIRRYADVPMCRCADVIGRRMPSSAGRAAPAKSGLNDSRRLLGLSQERASKH